MSTPFRFKNADNTTVDFEDYYIKADYFRSGNLWTWGNNSLYGHLGDNTITNRSSPVQTITFGSNWKQIALGDTITAAIKTDGTLWCWGYNSTGSLGDNTIADKSSPVQTIAGGTKWKQVSAGREVISAINTDGILWIWGRNLYGQLGDNTNTNVSSPIQTVTFGTNWKQVSCGAFNIAAIKTDGTLWNWGYNNVGQLGDNTTTHRSSPVQTVAGGTNWKQVSAGYYHTAAIKTDGTLWIWGSNSYGLLGDNTIVKKSSPVQTIAFGTNWKQVSVGAFYHIAATKTDGTLWSWGLGTSGQLGDNTILSKSSPVQTVAFGTKWKQVSCGRLHTAAVKTDGTLWAWGDNPFGNLGDNTTDDRSSPVQTIMFGTNWKETFCGVYYYTAAIQYQDDYQ
jgi:alpha-tubulin suppressor-like RCC1 family protein